MFLFSVNEIEYDASIIRGPPELISCVANAYSSS